ncbi:MAG: response regulator transcription factor [Saprospiraceae bacterium]|nr:response regulator transcription factor [Saprospiraceae bacterium]
MTCVLIDDEIQGRTALKSKLEMHLPSITVLGEAENGKQGMELIKSTSPDLVFLDVEMPVMTGFEMLTEMKERNFQVIFITAFDHYAIRALRFAAFDYLLKPIDAQELIECIHKLEKNQYPLHDERIQLLQNKNNQLALATSEGLIFCTLEYILFLEADSNYTHFYFTDNTRQLVSKTLKDFEDILNPEMFFRCHHSYLINLQHVRKYLKNENQIEMTNGKKVDLSRRKKEEFLKRMMPE